MNKVVAACGLALVALLATACSTAQSARPTAGISPAASPATVSPNNVEELSGEAGLWPAAGGG